MLNSIVSIHGSITGATQQRMIRVGGVSVQRAIEPIVSTSAAANATRTFNFNR
jgi:hypothetical protein